MLGMHRITGKPLGGADHVIQSVRDIITTPKGTRVFLREYGCAPPDMIDRPINELFNLELQANVAEALARWEPRFRLDKVWITGATEQGRVVVSIEGTIKATGVRSRLEGIEL